MMSKVFNPINADLVAYEKTLAKKTSAKVGGIYYDDPNSLVDQTKMRLTAGILVRNRSP